MMSSPAKSNLNDLTFTAPIFSADVGVLFSVYAVGHGYYAFTLSYEAACEKLGACSQERQQVLLAFKLNRPRITRAIRGKGLATDGRRVVLEASDFT
jgi:hypothetical protein